MARKFNFTKAANSVKTVYNKSHAGFKKANAYAKKVEQGAQFLNNMINAVASTHKDRRVRKANCYLQKGNAVAQKGNKVTQTGMKVANVAKSKLDQALDDSSNNGNMFV